MVKQNSKGSVLVTDSLFIFDEHIQEIKNAGYSVQRLDVPKATEEQLIDALEDKVGYILGGVEQVTDKVIEASKNLRVISFTGAGYSEFIPGYKTAKSKGIAITAAKGGNADAVAEFAITYALMAIRRIPQLTHPNGKSFITTKSARDSVLGIIGYGAIGSRVARLANGLGFSVLIGGRKKISGLPSNMRQVSLEELLSESDVISLHVDKVNGSDVLSSKELEIIKPETSIINVAFEEAVNQIALAAVIMEKQFTYMADHPISPSLEGNHNVVCTKSQSAFNTKAALRRVSNQTTRSLLSILESGEDEFRVV